MNALKRREVILTLIENTGEVYVLDLVKILKVTSETIRRDLSILAENDKIEKIHGGAIKKQVIYEDKFTKRLNKYINEKSKIGKFAASLISKNDTIFIDSCTTNLVFSRFLPNISFTVFTNSSLIADEIASKNELSKIYVLGGEYYSLYKANLGTKTIEDISLIKADLCFIGSGGISTEFGISVSNVEEALVSKAMIRNSSRRFVLADSSKFEKQGTMSVSSVLDITAIITDKKPLSYKKYLNYDGKIFFASEVDKIIG